MKKLIGFLPVDVAQDAHVEVQHVAVAGTHDDDFDNFVNTLVSSDWPSCVMRTFLDQSPPAIAWVLLLQKVT